MCLLKIGKNEKEKNKREKGGERERKQNKTNKERKKDRKELHAQNVKSVCVYVKGFDFSITGASFAQVIAMTSTYNNSSIK